MKNNNESGNLGNISKVSGTMFSIGFYEIDLIKDFFCIFELIICFFFFRPLIWITLQDYLMFKYLQVSGINHNVEVHGDSAPLGLEFPFLVLTFSSSSSTSFTIMSWPDSSLFLLFKDMCKKKLSISWKCLSLVLSGLLFFCY